MAMRTCVPECSFYQDQKSRCRGGNFHVDRGQLCVYFSQEDLPQKDYVPPRAMKRAGEPKLVESSYDGNTA